MADWTIYHIQPREDGWAVVKEGASRASSVAPTKEAALALARDYAHNQKPSKIVVHKDDGSVHDTFTYPAPEANGAPGSRDRLPHVDTQVLMHEVKVRGDQLVDQVRAIMAEGNARRIIIKKDGRPVLELPLSIGVGGAAAALMFSPVLAALGAFAALVSDVSVLVERRPETEATPTLPPVE